MAKKVFNSDIETSTSVIAGTSVEVPTVNSTNVNTELVTTTGVVASTVNTTQVIATDLFSDRDVRTDLVKIKYDSELTGNTTEATIDYDGDNNNVFIDRPLKVPSMHAVNSIVVDTEDESGGPAYLEVKKPVNGSAYVALLEYNPSNSVTQGTRLVYEGVGHSSDPDNLENLGIRSTTDDTEIGNWAALQSINSSEVRNVLMYHRSLSDVVLGNSANTTNMTIFGDNTRILGDNHIKLDSTDKSSVESYFKHMSQIDVLFNAVGFVHHGTLLECDDVEFHRSVNVNIYSAYLMSYNLLPKMLDNGKGNIIIICYKKNFFS